jgi:hypothetical protein
VMIYYSLPKSVSEKTDPGWEQPAGMTHIVIRATVAKHGDAPAAKFQDEKRIVCHGWDGRKATSLLSLLRLPLYINRHHPRQSTLYSVTLLCSLCALIHYHPALSAYRLLLFRNDDRAFEAGVRGRLYQDHRSRITT